MAYSRRSVATLTQRKRRVRCRRSATGLGERCDPRQAAPCLHSLIDLGPSRAASCPNGAQVILNYSSAASALTPWVMGGAAILAAIVAAWTALRSHRKTRLVEHITAERAKWRAELRAEMAKLSATLHTAVSGKKMDQKSFHEARVGILLRINPVGRQKPQPPQGGHRLDLTIDQKLRALATRVSPPLLEFEGARQDLLSDLRLLEHAVQELLKQEWEGSKDEALTGQLKRSATQAN